MPVISEVRGGGTPLGGVAGSPRGASGFAVPLADTTESSATDPADAAAPVTLAGALALQELGCEAPQDRAARRRGYDLLAALRALQCSLLAEWGSGQPVADLAALTVDVPAAQDERLRQVIDALVLRARVELARHES